MSRANLIVMAWVMSTMLMVSTMLTRAKFVIAMLVMALPLLAILPPPNPKMRRGGDGDGCGETVAIVRWRSDYNDCNGEIGDCDSGEVMIAVSTLEASIVFFCFSFFALRTILRPTTPWMSQVCNCLNHSNLCTLGRVLRSSATRFSCPTHISCCKRSSAQI